jgi:hypothetical protein
MTGSFAERLYENLRPLAGEDEANDWQLLHFVSALAKPHQLVEDLGRDTEDGHPGWSLLLDLERCPAWALEWLAQFVGVRLLPREGFETEETWDAAMRDRMRRADGRNRGSPDAVRAAAQRYLTGAKTLFFMERFGGAYRLGVRTLRDETPDLVATAWGDPLNLVPNPSAEVDTAGWAVLPGATSTIVLSRVADWAAPGAGAASFRAAGNVATGESAYAHTDFLVLPDPSAPQFAAVEVDVGALPAGAGVAVLVNWWTAGVAYNGQTAGNLLSADGRTTLLATPPPGSVYAVVYVGVYGGAGPGGAYEVRFDAAMLAESAVPLGYFDGDSDGGGGWVGAAHASASEQPITWDSPTVRAAILEQKPAGILLDYAVVRGHTYATVELTYDDYAEVESTFLTYADLRDNLPA